MRIITVLVLCTILVYGLAAFFYFSEKSYSDISTELSKLKDTTIGLHETDEGKKVFLPSPLKSGEDARESILTKAGVVQWTNSEREKEGLNGLRGNALLDKAAELKLEDMFDKQYFSHIAPSGAGPSDWVHDTGYSYIAIGENLAQGNFENDQSLVKAWMDSPGHRENILNEIYREIGVSVKKVMFEGKSTWLAVQVFGLPQSACPMPPQALKFEIEHYDKTLSENKAELNSLQGEIESIHARRDRDLYLSKMNEYNTLVSAYNSLIEKREALASDYNAKVNSYNQCIAQFQ